VTADTRISLDVAQQVLAAQPFSQLLARPEPTGKYADRARRHHAIMHELLAQGRGPREIARQLGWGLHTVQRYAPAATWQELAGGRWQGPWPSKLNRCVRADQREECACRRSI
jgi:hypothetical protein